MDSEKYVVAGIIDLRSTYAEVAKSGLTAQDFADEKLAKISPNGCGDISQTRCSRSGNYAR